MQWAKSWSFVDSIDQDQTAQNMQSDLDPYCPLVKSTYVLKFFVGLSGSYLLSLKEVGLNIRRLKG